MSGIKSKNLVEQQGTSWEDLYQIDVDSLTNATRANFFVQLIGNDKATFARCIYTGADALTIAEFNNLPIGSVIHAVGLTAPAIYYKKAATTWVYTAVNT